MPSPLFNSPRTARLPQTTETNAENAPAYKLDDFHALCQVACTGTFTSTFYDKSGGKDQLDQVVKLAANVPAERLAKLAVYARQRGVMKDMPQALLILLSKKSPTLFGQIFNRVVTDGRTLRTFVQLLTSGKFGRRTMSYAIRKAVNKRIASASPDWMLSASIGAQHPTLKDVLRLSHFKPTTNTQRAMDGWLCDFEMKHWAPAGYQDLPGTYRLLDAYRRSTTEDEQVSILSRPEMQRVRWDLLSDAAKGPIVWQLFASLMGPKALRMNLNTLARHGAFNNPEVVNLVARRLADPDEVKRSHDFPFVYFMAYLEADPAVPQQVKSALHKAAELACGNIPSLLGPVAIGIDVSSSMQSPATGVRGAGTSKASCVMVASLFGAALWRNNPGSLLIPFDDKAFYPNRLDPNDSLLSLAERISQMGGGGTDCSAPLKVAYEHRLPLAGCILLSDNQSWFGENRSIYQRYYSSIGEPRYTQTVDYWDLFKKLQRGLGKYPHPKYVGINLQPSGQAQNPEGKEVMNIGGFSDAVFDTVSAFFEDDSERFVRAVDSISLSPLAIIKETGRTGFTSPVFDD